MLLPAGRDRREALGIAVADASLGAEVWCSRMARLAVVFVTVSDVARCKDPFRPIVPAFTQLTRQEAAA